MDASARADDHRMAAPEVATVVEIDTNLVRIGSGAQIELPVRVQGTYENYVKPVIDFVGALILLVVTSPLLLGCALAVRLRMGSPVILRQNRVGQHGKVFTIYKFRTMEPDRRSNNVAYIGEDRRQTHKDPNDPRLTPLGRFLRSWSLDELPQFLNVLKGDMSLVGPRPEMVDIVAKYAPWQHERHTVKPGVTGPWQISERGGKALHECTESDIDYLRTMSARTDLLILAMTPLAALGMRRGH